MIDPNLIEMVTEINQSIELLNLGLSIIILGIGLILIVEVTRRK